MISTLALAAIHTDGFRYWKDQVGDIKVPAARIQGEKGEIQVLGPLYRPTSYRLFKKSPGPEVVDRKYEFEGGAHGMMVGFCPMNIICISNVFSCSMKPMQPPEPFSQAHWNPKQ
jgi:hypothetical protein